MSENIKVKAPWLKNYGNVPHTLDYFDGTMFEAVELIAKKYPQYTVYDFMGKKTTYRAFMKQVERCARALKQNRSFTLKNLKGRFPLGVV